MTAARDRGFKVLAATSGDSALALARESQPDAILMDIEIPVVEGMLVLHRLKLESSTRHIPVFLVVPEGKGRDAVRAGAVQALEKPWTAEQLTGLIEAADDFISRDVRNLLVVEDDETERTAIAELIGSGDDVAVTTVGSSEEAFAELAKTRFDCMVLDLKLPDMTGFDLLEKLRKDKRYRLLPVIVYTGKELTRREETKLRRYAETIIVKDASSPERLLDETSLYLHRMAARMPTEQRRMIEHLHSADEVFVGKRVLIVDDDVRNVFALTSTLEARGMDVLYAENGRDGIDVLKESPDVSLVLMDIMMPEMDGYETTSLIRKDERFTALPIIALTAKAMKGDRERSIAAGASDYITKPVDIDQLLSLMRVWLYQ
jgi:CheY-like chemotaxis protein